MTVGGEYARIQATCKLCIVAGHRNKAQCCSLCQYRDFCSHQPKRGTYCRIRMVGPAVLRDTVNLNNKLTPYVRYGDWIGRIACWVLLF